MSLVEGGCEEEGLICIAAHEFHNAAGIELRHGSELALIREAGNGFEPERFVWADMLLAG